MNRDRPDLAKLANLTDPTAFVWAVLPHAARSFATSIVMLPEPQSRTAAVAYLYCRMLDTYEDLTAPEDRTAALTGFAARMASLEPPPEVPLMARDNRDRVHVLLVKRCELVDRVFLTLPEADRKQVIALVEAMAAGMVWAAQRFRDQGGVLVDAAQVSRYCRYVIGEPVLFAIGLVADVVLTPELREDALAVGELVQLANITRDVERDLERGIGYHPSLRDHLGTRDAGSPVRRARTQLAVQALPHVSAYVRLWERIPTGRVSPARASAVLMLLHTDRHYDSCVRKVGHQGWREPRMLWPSALLASLSKRWTMRVMKRVERDFLAAAASLSRS